MTGTATRNHSHEEELESWRSQLRETLQLYAAGNHRLALCNGKGMDCMYAHSQEELDRWHEEAADMKCMMWAIKATPCTIQLESSKLL